MGYLKLFGTAKRVGKGDVSHHGLGRLSKDHMAVVKLCTAIVGIPNVDRASPLVTGGMDHVAVAPILGRLGCGAEEVGELINIELGIRRLEKGIASRNKGRG
jgi:hypothetical protein